MSGRCAGRTPHIKRSFVAVIGHQALVTTFKSPSLQVNPICVPDISSLRRLRSLTVHVSSGPRDSCRAQPKTERANWREMIHPVNGPTEAHYAGQRVLFESRKGVVLVFLGSDDGVCVCVLNKRDEDFGVLFDIIACKTAR